MAEIRITLKSDLCAGSGESLGNVVDTDMCVDAFGLPVIPARRIKGCLRQAAEELQAIGAMDSGSIDTLFGNALDKAGVLSIGDAELEDVDELRAMLLHGGVRGIPGVGTPAQVSRMFTTIRGQTKMEDGVAASGSLRYTRVLNHTSPMTGKDLCLVAPVSLGECKDASGQELTEALQKCCKALRHMGMHRNRGLGWVSVEWLPEDQRKPKADIGAAQEEATVRLSYRVALDANLVLSGIDGSLTAIPGRSVIGCMAGAWVRGHGDPEEKGEEKFRRLFLSGEVKWSDLTPVIDGQRSTPAPLMLANLKNRKFSVENAETVAETGIKSEGDAMYGNRLTDENFGKELASGGWRGEKLKTVEGLWAVENKSGWRIAGVETDTMYHHRHERIDKSEGQNPNPDDEAMLYAHTSVPAGLIYGGEVAVPEDLADEVKSLLQTAELRFGHSRNAQYARCSLQPAGFVDEPARRASVEAGEPVFVVLESNMLCSANGRYALDNASVREAIGKALEGAGLSLSKQEGNAGYTCPAGYIDYVQYTTIGGYHAMWKLQKPQTSVVMGGSAFCFAAAEGKEIPAEFTLGEYLQEGMGRCRIISLEQMKAKKIISRTRIDTRYQMPEKQSDAQKAFKQALLIAAAEETIPASAVALAEEVLNEKNGPYKDLDDGRLRTMLEEAGDLQNLRERLKPRKEDAKLDSKKKAAKKLLDLVFGPDNAVVSTGNLLRTNDELLAGVNGLDGKIKQKFCEDNWKRLLSIILKIFAHSTGTNDADAMTGEEAQG